MAPKNEKPAEAGVTEEQVKQMIAEAIKGLVTEDQVKILIVDSQTGVAALIAEAIKDLVTGEQVIEVTRAQILEVLPSELEKSSELILSKMDELKNDLLELVDLTTAGASDLSGVEDADLFDESLLEGHEIDGRPLTTDDILSGSKSDDGVVTIVTRDGRKIEL